MDKLNLKEWADKRDKDMRLTIDALINGGVRKEEAVCLVLKSSTLGQGYKAQLLHDYGINPFSK